jgi:hypothetical protein
VDVDSGLLSKFAITDTELSVSFLLKSIVIIVLHHIFLTLADSMSIIHSTEFSYCSVLQLNSTTINSTTNWTVHSIKSAI